MLGRADDPNLAQGVVKSDLDGIDLGALKANLGGENYDLPAATDLNKYNAVVIYSQRPHVVLGLAKLESF